MATEGHSRIDRARGEHAEQQVNLFIDVLAAFGNVIIAFAYPTGFSKAIGGMGADLPG